jgi:hypothetical protein
VQITLGVGGCGNILIGHVLVAVRQGQRRDAAATEEEQLGRFAARKIKYIRLYMYSGKLILEATYLGRVFVDGRSFAAGAPALTHVFTVGACGTKPRRGPPAALSEAGVWRHAWGDGALRQQGAMMRMAPARPSRTPQNSAGSQLLQYKFFWCRFEIRNGPLLVCFQFLCAGCSRNRRERTTTHQNPHFHVERRRNF